MRILLLLILFCLCASTSAEELAEETVLLDRIVAIVNDDVIVMSELQREAIDIVQKLRQKDIQLPPQNIILEQALERLIMTNLQLAEAKRLGITADEETLANALTNIARRNKLTLPEFQEALIEQGMSLQSFRESLRQQIVLARLRNREVMNRIQVSKAEVDNYLTHEGASDSARKSVHLFHILLSTPDGASPGQIAAAREKADGILDELRNGADFRSLAQAKSDGRKALSGGDMGWLEPNQIPSLFAEQLAKMDRGQIAGPFRSSSGFHIILLQDYKGESRAMITQTRARHILIRTDELTSDKDAQVRLGQLYQRLQAGDDFATLARSHSDDTGSAIKGGDLGWVNPGDTVPKFEEVMNELQPGETSPPFKSQFGWHILQVQERRDHDASEDVRRTKARATLRDRKADEAMELYLRRLRDEAFVDIRLKDEY